ncbi:CRISPR-associated protein Cas5h [Anaerobranca californiensis DSM 14826]|jgi:CRISPR-associated protein Cas5h|uniref:CRISPR-associated protein Cas5h n=2 Tax=Anaerobranca TaxID=42447 RepID=A0A1M6RZ89_9FIRM|nr:CRISPR-associated protein Cas5h [Anaerobranca californiensis DSM 14826]
MASEVVIFDIVGCMGHFRKYYTNSSSLSYSVPTRTNLIGLVAGVMGYQRDSYYSELNSEKLQLALQKLTKTRKIIQSLNYMKITTKKHFTEPTEHTQIPFEIIMGEGDSLKYRVYLSHCDPTFLKEFEERIKNKKYFFPPYLGAAPFSCKLEYVNREKVEKVRVNDSVYISTVIPLDKVKHKGLDFKKLNFEYALVKEKMPRDFEGERVIKEVNSYLFDENCNPIPIVLDDSYYQVRGTNILYM